jgi:hypothetical protein
MIRVIRVICMIALWTRLRYVGAIALLFLIKTLHLIGVWFGVDRRTNTINTHFLREIGLHLQIL